MTNEGLRVLVERLAEARKVADNLKAELVEKEATWEAEWEHANGKSILALAEALLQMQELEADIRAKAVIAYNADPERNKDLGNGIKIREVTKLEYDPDKALNWAVTHNMALSLNVKGFEGLVKLTPRLFPFVTRTEEPQATIATNLEAALEAKP